MSNKVTRFLNSILIENVDDFDMDFVVAKLDPNDSTNFLMVLRKKTGWNYFLWEEFHEALANIEYSYSLSFEYDEISEESLTSFFKDWYLASRHGDCYWNLEVIGSKLCISALNPASKEDILLAAADFTQLLKLINYPYVATYKETLLNDESERKAHLKEVEKEYLEEKKLFKYNQNGNYRKLNTLEGIEDIPSQNIEVVGEVFGLKSKTISNGKLSLTFILGDDFNAVNCSALENENLPKEELISLEDGLILSVLGKFSETKSSLREKELRIDSFKVLPPKELRKDVEEVKRVELHLHTKMSAMDGLGEMEKYCKVAKSMGMEAIAVTDHGNIQAFPDLQKYAAKNSLKPIYGCEFYMFEPHQKYVFNPSDIKLQNARYCVLDLETTGLSAIFDRITEFGGVIIQNGLIIDRFDTLVNPKTPIPLKIQAKTHITDEMVKEAPTIEEVMGKIEKFLDGAILVTHNASFDFSFLNEARRRMGLEPFNNPVIDTLALSHFLFPEKHYHNLGAFSNNLGLDIYIDEEAHRADYDAEVLSEVWSAALARLDPNHTLRHKDLMNLQFNEDSFTNLKGKDLDIRIKETTSSFYKHIRANHLVALVKDEQGLKDLYELVSLSNTTYLADVPKIPRFELERLRGHLLLGSACFNGEVFDTAKYSNFETLKKVISFYDYVEIQPLENYSYLINIDDVTEERLHQMLDIIIKAADEVGVPIVATGDCHYVNPEDKITRDVFISTKAIGGGRHPLNPPFRDRLAPFANPSQHFRSTREMLDCFESFVSKERAYEFVVTNSKMIASNITIVEPIKADVYPPDANLPGSAELLRNLCYKNLHLHYGDNPDTKIVERLEKELNGIINNGYSVIYYIAHKIIAKAKEDGIFVGSRGSVGSSFAATMADITEVNPLPPHYLCPHCHHLEWNTNPKIKSGFDLPSKKCPNCKKEMLRNGQNIPFETFLGFHAEKVPDIDLNFPPDYQGIAHNYLRSLLGEANCFRAGTIQTVADKNAFGYVRGYFERLGFDPNSVSSAKIGMIAEQCKGVKRTTGQHPGGIVVIPKNMSVFDFTPYQYPAEDIGSDWLTTHYDFNSMHDEVLKLDMLGHIEPMVIRKIAEKTKIPFESIPMDDKKALSLFSSPKALNLKTNALKLKVGSLCLPETGTDFVMRMLSDTHPKTFNDLLVVSGLSHGTDVYSNNVETLIKNNVADLSSVIGCRDDIMSYFLSLGIDSSEAFKFMEIVRKNKNHCNLAKIEEMIPSLRKQGVPEWYLECCKKIQYLFPRAHATAYVMNAVRNAWYKVYKPLEFYSVYLAEHCDKWDVETMKKGLPSVIAKIRDYELRIKNRKNPLSEKEKELLSTLKVAAEMLDRGYKFHNIDLYKSDAHDFVVDEENKALYPPFMAIDGIGLKAAETVVEARKDGEFLSKEDLHDRTSLSETNIQDLSKLGVLDGMGESNQMSIFDF